MIITVFKKWTSAVLYLDEKIKNGRLIAGRNIQLENTGNGIRIHGSPGGVNGDSYNGYFKVIQTAENKIKIVDGLDYDASACGTALINDTSFGISSSEFTITANSWIYLITHYDEDDEIIVNDGLQAFTSQQSFEYDKSKVLISRVKFSNSAITDFSHEQYGPIRDFIGGDCSGAVLV
jgi:hypothetical protein